MPIRKKTTTKKIMGMSQQKFDKLLDLKLKQWKEKCNRLSQKQICAIISKSLNKNKKFFEMHADVQLLKHVSTLNTRTLDEHSRKLDEHSRKLDEHSRKLDEHSVKLDEHSRILDEHTKMLNKILITQDDHSTKIDALMDGMGLLLEDRRIYKPIWDAMLETTRKVDTTESILTNHIGDKSVHVDRVNNA